MTCETRTPFFLPEQPRPASAAELGLKTIAFLKQTSSHQRSTGRRQRQKTRCCFTSQDVGCSTVPDSCGVAQQAPAGMLRISCFRSPARGAARILAKLSSGASWVFLVSEPSKTDLASGMFLFLLPSQRKPGRVYCMTMCRLEHRRTHTHTHTPQPDTSRRCAMHSQNA